MVAYPPEPPDIHSVIEQLDSAVEQLPDVPDWFWQGLAVWAVGKGIEWTWKHREAIAQSLKRQPVLHEYLARIDSDSELTLRITHIKGGGSASTAKAGGGIVTVEVPTPSLTERLVDEGLELLSFYQRHV